MKNIEKRVNTDLVDYATNFKASNLSMGGQISCQRQHLLYTTKNADITHFTAGRSETKLGKKQRMKKWLSLTCGPSLLSPGKPMGRGEEMDVCADTPSVGLQVVVVGSWDPLNSLLSLVQVGLPLRESGGFLVGGTVRKDK